MKTFKLPNPLWILLAILSVFLFFSCGIVNKNKSTFQSSTDSSGSTVKKSLDVKNNDSTGIQKSEKQSEEKHTIDESSGLGIKFAKDSTKPTGPIKITTDSAGNTTIDPGGRSIESITDTRKKTTTQKTSVKQLNSDSGHIVKNEYHATIDTTGNHVNKNVKASENHTFRLNIPWYVYVIIIVIGVIVCAIAFTIEIVRSIKWRKLL